MRIYAYISIKLLKGAKIMEKSRKELIDKLLKELGKLPPNEQKAIVFIINNFSIIKKRENSRTSRTTIS